MALSFTNITTVAGNTAPPITLTAQRSGSVIDLTSATSVKLYIINASGTQTNTGHESCTITSAVGGVVTYARQANDIPTKGTYKADLKITYSDTTQEVMYAILRISARARLAGE